MSKIKLFSIGAIFVFCGLLLGAEGYLMEYETSGVHTGGTRVEGNLKIILKNGVKRISGTLVFYETGNPYPNIEEREVIVDIPSSKKYFITEGLGQWNSLDLKGDFNLLKDDKIRVEYNKTGNTALLKLSVNYPVLMGGTTVYSITYTYGKDANRDKIRLQAIGKPSPSDIAVYFLDNEKIADTIQQKLGEDRYNIPEKFRIVCEQAGKISFDITGTLRSAQPLNLADRDFQTK